MKKRILSLLLAVMMLVGMLPATALATEEGVSGDPAGEVIVNSIDNDSSVVSETGGEENCVASVNGVGYPTLQDAIDKAAEKAEVTLLADIEATGQILIQKSLTLDLGAYTISGNRTDAILRAYSPDADTVINVDIRAEDTGGIINIGTGYAIYVGMDIKDGNDEEKTNLTINGGVYATSGADCIRQIMGRCTINGGSYKSSFSRTVVNGERWYGSEFKINGGTFYGFNPACVSVWTGFNGSDHTNHYYHQHDIIAEGKTTVYSDGWYTVVDGETAFVVKSKSLCWYSVERAISEIIAMNDVDNHKELTLLAGAELTMKYAQLASENAFTFVLDGHTLTLPAVYELKDKKVVRNWEAVAEINGTKYPDLQSAINDAEAGATIKLLAEVTLTEGLKVAADDDLTLDLNGFTVSYESSETTGNAAITNKGNLTIKDSVGTGKITYESSAPDNVNYSYGTNTITNNGTLTVDANVENTTNGGSSNAIDNNNNLANVSLTINGGEITAVKVAVRQVNFHATNTNTLTINGGSITGFYAVSVQKSTAGTGAMKLDITGGTLTATHASYPDAIYSSATTGIAQDNVAITVSGGTFDGDITIGGGGDSTNVESLTITGGTFKGTISTSDTENNINISGGTFSVEPNADYLADGCELASGTDDQGNVVYGVTKKNYVAQVGDTQFESLQAAINDAEAGATVKLLADVALTETLTVAKEQTVTLDLAGHTITGTDTKESGNFELIANKGTLTIKDSVGNGKITLTATTNRQWNAASVVVLNDRATLTVESGTIQHLGGTDMAYAIDNRTNTGAENATVNITGGTIDSTYRGIRMFANSEKATVNLNITGGNVTGTNKAVILQSANAKANPAALDIKDSASVGSIYVYAPSDATAVKVSIKADTLAEGAEVTSKLPEGYELPNTNGTYGVVAKAPYTLGRAYLSWKHETDKKDLQIWGEVVGTEGINSFVVNFYDANNEKVASTTLKQPVGTTVSWHLRIAGNDDKDWWTYEWVGGSPNPDKAPATAEFIINGKNCGSIDVEMEHEVYAHEDNWADYFKASVNGTYYFTLQEAIDAAESGQTVTLHANPTEAMVTVKAGKDVDIDFKNKTLYGSMFVEKGATADLKDGTIYRTDTVAGIEVQGVATLTNMNITSARHAIRVDGLNTEGTALTIHSGIYQSNAPTGWSAHAVNAGEGSNVIIKDGTFIGAGIANAGGTGNCVMVKDATTTVSIEGGLFYGANGVEGSICAAEKLTISGGKFYDDDKTWNYAEFMAEGYVAVACEGKNYNFEVVEVTNWLDVANTSWYDASKTAFTITTPEELAGLAKLVNEGKSMSGVTITLGKDIDLSGTAYGFGATEEGNLPWPGIGIYSQTTEGTAFQGTFNGGNDKGYEITGVTFENTSSNKYRGFFNQLYKATVKNLTVNGNGFESDTTGDYGGAMIAGHAIGSTIEGCVAEGTFVGTHNVAGIVVLIQGSTIKNCTNKANLTGSYSKLGGIVNFSQHKGVDANYKGSLIENCVNEGTITSTTRGENGVGGIIGWIGYGDGPASSDAAYAVTIKDCENKGTITATQSAKVGQIVGSGESYIVDGGNNKGLTTMLSIGDNNGYFAYATVENGIATYVTALEAGKSYLVTAPGAKPVIELASGEFITFDQTLATFDDTGIKAVAELNLNKAVDGNQVTFTAENAVAEVGGKYYATLEDAITAAQNGQTVTLLANVELDAFVRITSDITLDLNGKTITTAESFTTGGIILVGDYANSKAPEVTVTGNGNIISSGYALNVSAGKLTIENGTFKGVDTAVQIQRGTLTINGGSYEVTPSENNEFKDHRYTINKLDKYASEATVTINGGYFKGFNPSCNLAEGQHTNFAKDGYIGQADEKGVYTLVDGTNETEIPAVPATCTTTGLTAGVKCKFCGKVLDAQETVDALGHTEEIVPGKDATCTDTGLTEGKKCSVCGEILVEQTVVEMLDHNYAYTDNENGTHAKTCTVGGEFVTEGHTYTEGKCACGAEKSGEPVVVDRYSFGQNVQIGLIEPWFVRVNAKVSSNNEVINYTELKDYGVYFVRGSDLATGATQESLEWTDIVNNSNVLHYSHSANPDKVKVNPAATDYLMAEYDKDIFTYQMSNSIFVMFYVIDSNGAIDYAPIRERNIKKLLDERKDNATDFANGLERDTYAAQSNLETAIVTYRNQFSTLSTLPEMTAPKLSASGYTFAANTQSTYTFGNNVQLVLIEPWGIKVNATVKNSGNVIDYAAAEDYGFIIYYDVDGTYSANGMTAETLYGLSDAYVFSKSNGQATVNAQNNGYITATYNKGIYTYQLNSNAYVMAFVKDSDGYHYGEVKVRNVYELAKTRANDTVNFTNTLERTVYQEMVDMYDAITAYRTDYFAKLDTKSGEDEE